ncbi:MAG TPA: hypothetical protein VN752_01275, partial [Solirubrobacterales bacterium]|nr:hypothetical protein [Solirubrobacterales bacterium]
TRLMPFPNPEDRGWEMVSPVDKNYTDIYGQAGLGSPNEVAASIDGESVGYCTRALFGDDPGNMYTWCAPYIARRTSSGWQTTHPFPQLCYVSQAFNSADTPQWLTYLSPNFDRYVMSRGESDGCPDIPPLDPAAPMEPNGVAENLYFHDLLGDPGEFVLLNNALTPGFRNEKFYGASDDFSHIVFNSFVNQTAPPDSPAPGTFAKPYLWIRQGFDSCTEVGGCLTLLSKDPSGNPFTVPTGLPTLHISNSETHPLIVNAVSNDGQRVYFHANLDLQPSGGLGICSDTCQVYMRENSSTTYHVSASECTASCGGSPERNEFIYATPGGSKAFFFSCSKLTDESSPEGSECGSAVGEGKLYRWDRDAAPGHRLVDLSVDHEPSDGIQPGIDQEDLGAFVGASDDGDIAYFVAGGQLVAGEPTFAPGTVEEEYIRGTGEKTGIRNGRKLYRWRWNGGDPVVDYLGPYKEFLSAFLADENTTQEQVRVTPDGNYVLIYSRLRYDPAADTDEDADAYRWDEENGWLCVSCQAPGVPSSGEVDVAQHKLWYENTYARSVGSDEPRVFMTDDGHRIFFGTTDALVSEDVNGTVECPLYEHNGFYPVNACLDVYEWNDGAVHLVSTGTSDKPARLVSSTRTGRDVFVITNERLVGWDRDLNGDIYDARIGGGFPEPPPRPASCEGEACRGTSSVAAPSTGAGSAVFEGPADPKSTRGKCRKAGKKGRCAKRKKHRRNRGAKNNRRAVR